LWHRIATLSSAEECRTDRTVCIGITTFFDSRDYSIRKVRFPQQPIEGILERGQNPSHLMLEIFRHLGAGRD
jgi:hypothetical protein